MSRRFAALSWAALVACACASESGLGEDVYTWGKYSLCLTRVVDTCHDEGLACGSIAQDTARTALVGARLATGESLFSRGSQEAAKGRQVGTRLETRASVELPGFCNCTASVDETIRVELLPDEPAACASPDAGSEGCTPDGVTPLPDPAFGDDWLNVDGGWPTARTNLGIRGRIIDVITPRTGETKCTCVPCRVEYDVVGRR